VSKLVIIGIDGLDPFLLNKWKNELPHLGSLFEDTSEIKIESTFPPDSICAWASIYTGENPAEHGLLESIDYLAGKKPIDEENRSTYFKGRTFWDLASKNGKTVCVINPFVAYPAWKVNGIMVSGPVFEGGKPSAYPESVLSEYEFPPLGGMTDFPEEKQLNKFISDTKKVTDKLLNVSLNIYKDYKPDLFFLSFLTLDRIKHFLWRFTDNEDMYYPGENSFKNVIKEFYLSFDKAIGRFIDSLEKNSAFLVISDHGHRRRCSKCLNLNEILRKEGYLMISTNGIKGYLKRVIEKSKIFTITTISKYGFQDWIYKVAKFVPYRKELKKSTYLIDKNNSPVTLSNLCGTNPYGGIDINAKTIEDYEKLRERIINRLFELNRILKKDVVKWAKKREQIYCGKFENRLPDVMFELSDEYGVGMDFYTKPITINYSHKKISGGHKREAVLLLHSGDKEIENIKRPQSVVGIPNYILQIIDK
jgi:predicted AlkP superfamily phosphohydrolase/phosphomutase